MEDNKLIAEFMGLCPLSRSGFISDKNQEYYGSLSDLQYHTSWDWLIPVVEKMNTTELWDEYDISHLSIYLVSVDINATYREVVEFINQYNKNK